MDFTFGIVTHSGAETFIERIIQSIHGLNIPNYEILVVGDCKLEDPKLTVIPFDESVKSGWITRKKNILCERAAYENIVVIHDYIDFHPDWYKGFLKFGENYGICCSPVERMNGVRFRDYALYCWGLRAPFQDRCLIPYTCVLPDHVRPLLYISGAYYVIKKSIAIKFPLSEVLFHGAGEDVEYNQRLADNGILISCNPYSRVRFLKYKDQASWEHEISPDALAALQSLSPEEAGALFQCQKAHLKGWLASEFGITLPGGA